jgi:S-adenosylmethionine decarboxylase proenzyme
MDKREVESTQTVENPFLSATISGKHMICDLRGVNNWDLMNSVEGIYCLLDGICEKYCYQVLARNGHAFSPIGATVLYLLSESHISVHTFPERGYVAVDIYTCREMKDDSEYRDIYSSLVSAFDSNRDVNGAVILDRSFV